MYKNGKLTASARQRLSNKLERQNSKPRTKSRPNSTSVDKTNDLTAAMKNLSVTSSRSGTAKNESISNQSRNTVVSTAEPVRTADITRAVKASANKSTPSIAPATKQPKELTMDDLEDTPPPRKLVNERKAAMNNNGDVNWISVISYNQKEAENEQHLYKKLECKSNAKFRNQLDKQSEINHAQRQKAAKQKQEYRASLNKDYSRYKDEDNQKQVEQQKKVLELKNVRTTQMQEALNKRKYQELKLKKSEHRAATKLKRELEQEKKNKIKKKQENMQRLKQMLVDNEQQKTLKLEEQKKLEQQEIEMQKEYAKVLERQEKQRELNLKELQAKQQKKFDALVAASEDIHKKAERDAKRAEIEQIKRQQLADQKLLRKKEKLRAEMEECKRIIAQQIVEKERRIREEIEQDNEYGRRTRKLATQFEQEKKDKMTKKLGKQKEQAKYLEQQIAQNEKRRLDAKTEMSEAEKMLNKNLLDNVRDVREAKKSQGVPDAEIDKNAPFAWRYSYRKAPF